MERELNKQSMCNETVKVTMFGNLSNLFIFFFLQTMVRLWGPFRFSFPLKIWELKQVITDNISLIASDGIMLCRSSSRSPGVSCHTSPAHSRMVSSSSARSSLCDQDPGLVRWVASVASVASHYRRSIDILVLFQGFNCWRKRSWKIGPLFIVPVIRTYQTEEQQW